VIAPRAVILDNEPVGALINPSHPKHRRALAIVEALTARRPAQVLVVPTSVRVEAGWDRTAPRSAIINRLRFTDHSLDPNSANDAASIRAALGISTVDAHIAATMRAVDRPAVLVTSDVDDAQRIIGHLGIDASIVRL
jgi:predicted nucleic acid-binding protein